MNITGTFAHHARAVPDRPAIVHGERVVLFRELDPLVSRTAAHLYSLGLAQGDVVGVALKDSVEHLLILCAMARAGIVILPLDWRWTPAEQERVIAHFGAKKVLMEPGKPAPAGCPVVSVSGNLLSEIQKQTTEHNFPDGDLPLLKPRLIQNTR